MTNSKRRPIIDTTCALLATGALVLFVATACSSVSDAPMPVPAQPTPTEVAPTPVDTALGDYTQLDYAFEVCRNAANAFYVARGIEDHLALAYSDCATNLAADMDAFVAWNAPIAPVLCPTEDSSSCVWLADVQGNGEGRSFYTDADGVVTYLD